MRPDPAHHNEGVDPGSSPNLDALALRQGVEPLVSAEDLRADIWESDEELDAFLAEMRRSRDADLA